MTESEKPQLYVVLGATGGIGRAVVAAADAAGHQVRAVSRTVSSARGLPLRAERFDADVSTAEGAAAAVAGAAVVVHAAQPEYTRWREEFPALTRGIADAASAAGAKLVLADNLYMYGPQPDGVKMTEATPAAAIDAKGRVRASMAQDLLARHARGDLRIAIGRASDYFGPHGTGTALGDSFFPAALGGKTVNAVGSVNVPHTMSYLPDIAAGLLVLAERDGADGHVWHLPAGEPLTMRQFADLVAAEIGRPVKLRAIGARTLRLIGLVAPMMREIADVGYQWDAPFVSDDNAFRIAFPGEVQVTERRAAIAATVRWWQQDGRIRGGRVRPLGTDSTPVSGGHTGTAVAGREPDLPVQNPQSATDSNPDVVPATDQGGALDADLTAVATSLHKQYDNRLGASHVDAQIHAVADRFTHVRIRAFVPLFVRRYAGADLRAEIIRAGGPPAAGPHLPRARRPS